VTWIKIDDTLPNNPKILPLSDGAFRLYIEALCYCNQYLTDGFLADAVLLRLDINNNRKELVEACLWIECLDGMQINDYTEHQTAKSEVEKKREQNKERSSRYRSRVTNAEVTHPEYRIQNTDTEINTSSNKFDDFWSVYPRKVGKRDAERAYGRALKVATSEEIFEGAKRYAADPNRTAEFTAHPATWLNRGSWADDPIPSKSPANGSQRLATAPTPTPPRFTAEDSPRGAPMPDSVKALLGRLGDLRE
jgi:hypothetical protein